MRERGYLRELWGYLTRSFSIARRSAWGVAGHISLAITIVGGLVSFFWPRFGNVMNVLMWLVPLVCLVGFMFIGMLLADHHLYRQRDREATAKESELKGEIDGLRAQLRARDDPIRTELGTLIRQGEAFAKMLDPPSSPQSSSLNEPKDWIARACDFTRDHATEEWARLAAGNPMATAKGAHSPPSEIARHVRNCLEALKRVKGMIANPPD